MKKTRPVNLELSTIALPVMGVASILHRISAVIIWVAAAFFLLSLYISFSSADGFQQMQSLLAESFVVQFFTWGFMTAMGYYIAGGIKHLIQEAGYCEELDSGRSIARVAIGAGIVLSVLFGVWIWA